MPARSGLVAAKTTVLAPWPGVFLPTAGSMIGSPASSIRPICRSASSPAALFSLVPTTTPRVHGVAADAVRRPAPVELDREEHVGQFRLGVGGASVIAGGEVGVVPADRAEALGAGGDVDDSRALGGAQRGQEGERELEVAEVVGRQLHLVAACVPLRPAGGAGVVDQDVERTDAAEPAGREVLDRSGVDEVEPGDFDALDAGEGVGGAAGVARGDRDRCASPGKCAGDFEADAGVATGNDRVVARKVYAGEHVLGGRGGRERRADRDLLAGHAC